MFSPLNPHFPMVSSQFLAYCSSSQSLTISHPLTVPNRPGQHLAQLTFLIRRDAIFHHPAGQLLRQLRT
jgi:hypothetical protein